MPELPEVETIKNTVKTALLDARIEQAVIYQPLLRKPIPADFATKIKGAKIIGLRRLAKYMLMDLDNAQTIIWHFGMSGKIRIETNQNFAAQKHDHLVIYTDRGVLVYHDPRRFGLILPCESAILWQHPLFCHIGLDPWDQKLTINYLQQKLSGKKTSVKQALLDQEIICGIGNIYASEILYHARIRPDRTCESLKTKELTDIIIWTRKVLEDAIAAGGSTIHDYQRPDGDIGYFQEKHCVYNKTGQQCPECRCNIKKTGGIQKIVQNGRSTFYCASLQK